MSLKDLIHILRNYLEDGGAGIFCREVNIKSELADIELK